MTPSPIFNGEKRLRNNHRTNSAFSPSSAGDGIASARASASAAAVSVSVSASASISTPAAIAIATAQTNNINSFIGLSSHDDRKLQHQGSSSTISEYLDEGEFDVVDRGLVLTSKPSSDTFDEDRFLANHHNKPRRISAHTGMGMGMGIGRGIGIGGGVGGMSMSNNKPLRSNAGCIQMPSLVELQLAKSPVGKMFDYGKQRTRESRKVASQLRGYGKQKRKNRKKDGVPLTIDIDFTLSGNKKKISRAISGVSTTLSQITKLEDEFYCDEDSYNNGQGQGGCAKMKTLKTCNYPDLNKVRTGFTTVSRTASSTASRAFSLGRKTGKSLSDSWHEARNNGNVTIPLHSGLRRVSTSLGIEDHLTKQNTLTNFLEAQREIVEAQGKIVAADDEISDVSNLSFTLAPSPPHNGVIRDWSISPPLPQVPLKLESDDNDNDDDAKPVNVKSRINKFEGLVKAHDGLSGPVTPRRRGRGVSNILPQVASPPSSMFMKMGGPRFPNMFRPGEQVFSPAPEKANLEDEVDSSTTRKNLFQEPSHNDVVKIVLLGSPSPRSEKFSIASELSGCKRKKRSRNKVHANIYEWDQPNGSNEGRNIKANLWDLQSSFEDRPGRENSSNCRSRPHHATQSLFFSPNSLYIIVWDMAIHNPGANDFVPDDYSEDSDSEYESDEEYDKKKRDRVIQRDIDEHVMYWIRVIVEKKLSGCAIMPVVISSPLLDENEVNHRRSMLFETLAQYKPKGSIQPQIIADDKCESFPIISPNDPSGLDRLKRDALMKLNSILKDGSPRNAPSDFKDHFYCELSPVVISVRDAISEFKDKGFELLHFEQVYVKLAEKPPEVENFTQYHVREALSFLSSIGSIIFFDDLTSASIDQLSEYIILDPKWLSKAISQVLREDWRQTLNNSKHNLIEMNDDDRSTLSSMRPNPDCPHITSDETIKLWKASNYVIDQYDKLPEFYTSSICDFLQNLCEHLGIFTLVETDDTTDDTKQDCYLLSGMKDDVPPDFWSFKAKNDWKTTLCNSWILTESPPCKFFDQICGAVFEELTKLHTQSQRSSRGPFIRQPKIMCWKNAMYISVVEAMPIGDRMDTIPAEFFVSLVYPDSPLCVSTSMMCGNDLRLIVSAKGYRGKGCEKIWNLGYSAILDALDTIVENATKAATKQTMCPSCLLSTDPCKAHAWDAEYVAAHRNEFTIRCPHHGPVDTPQLLGPEDDDDNSTVATGIGTAATGICTAYTSLTTGTTQTAASAMTAGTNSPRSTFEQLSPSVVIVGHWDAAKSKILNVGSGFVCDSKLGLIMTAGHIFYDLKMNERIEPKIGKAFTSDKKDGRVQAVVGILKPGTTAASFQYIAEIIAHCTSDADACILRLTRKFESPADVVDGVYLPPQPEFPFGARHKISSEGLRKLKLSRHVELESNIRVLGYDQSGDGGLHVPGSVVHQNIGLTKGYVNKKLPRFDRFSKPVINSRTRIDEDVPHESGKHERSERNLDKLFVPQEEIVVICPTQIGTSGGPCVNEDGEVIGIVSRTDPIETTRCYLAPSRLINDLLRKAKNKCRQQQRTPAPWRYDA